MLARNTAKPGDRRGPQSRFASAQHRNCKAWAKVKRDNLQLPRVRERRRKMKNILLRAFPAFLLFIFFAAFTNAQSSRPDAQLPDTQVKGTLLDASGAGVGGVHVEARREGDRRGRP